MVMAMHVSSFLIRALVEVVQQRGIAPEALLGCAASSLIDDPTDKRVPIDEYQALLARAIQLTSEPALGLHCGLQASESSFGLMSPLVSYASSLRHALALVSQFRGLLSEEIRISLSERIGTAQLCCKPHVAIGRSMVELIIAGLVRTLRAFGCAGPEIHAVCFEHTRPAYHHAYTVAFGGAERFAEPFTGIEFSSQALDRPHMHWQPELHALMRAQAERTLEQLSRPLTCAERVRALLVGRREQTAPDMEVVARELDLSIRSLRRRLEEEGTSYRALIQSWHYDSACSLLRNPDLTQQAVGHALGFADASSFHRAFRRWTGLTPAEYREAALTLPNRMGPRIRTEAS
jgi:AraC-like DNA-binding protein